MQYSLSRQILRGRYSKWIIILQEFELEFSIAKTKKYLVSVELMSNFLQVNGKSMVQDSLPDESLFLIDSSDSWYWDILIYLQTQHFQLDLSKYHCRCIHHHTHHYLIINDVLYHHMIDMVLCYCVVHSEDECISNDYQTREHGGDLSKLVTAQNILHSRYF